MGTYKLKTGKVEAIVVDAYKRLALFVSKRVYKYF